MGCSSSNSHPQYLPPQTALGREAGNACPVPPYVGERFLEALRNEYVHGVGEACGKFFDDNTATSAAAIAALEAIETQVRESSDKNATIERIRAQWNLGINHQNYPQAIPNVPAQSVGKEQDILQSTPSGQNRLHTNEGGIFGNNLKVDPEESLRVVRQALNMPASAPATEVVPKGLQSQDPEIVRRSVHVACDIGWWGRSDVSIAAGRMCSAKQLPADWDMKSFAGGRQLVGGLGGRQDTAIIAFQEQKGAVVEELQSLLDSTYRKVYTRDRRGVPIPDRFVVREVQRVMNDQVWREYARYKEKIRSRRNSNVQAVPDGVLTMNHLKMRTAKTARPMALPQLDENDNEVWLFHGTTKEAAQGIAENDFRLDLTGSNAGTLLGKGIYLAENATKADEYGEGPKGPAGEEAEMGFEPPRPPPGPPPPLVRESYMLLCKSTLGQVRYTAEQRPDADDLQKSCSAGKADSVLGDRLKINGTFREFVIYCDDQVYPEYIIRYERIFFHERFAEIYAAMSIRKQRGCFHGPTPEETKVLSSLWNVFGMPNKGKINKWQLLDLLVAIKQPPANEQEDLDATFMEWDTKKDGWIDCDEFMQEMTQRVHDGVLCLE